MKIYKDREVWAYAVQQAGSNTLIRETGQEQYPTDIHLYAVGNNRSRLFGTWNMKTDEGVVFDSKKGMMFDTRKRTFNKEKF